MILWRCKSNVQDETDGGIDGLTWGDFEVRWMEITPETAGDDGEVTRTEVQVIDGSL